jgi:hypothetical protein
MWWKIYGIFISVVNILTNKSIGIKGQAKWNSIWIMHGR